MNSPSQTPLAEMNPPELAAELKWWSEHADTSMPYGQTLSRLLTAAAAMLTLGIPCPLCRQEGVGCGSQGERRWLHCFACDTNFTPEQETFQAGFNRGLAEGKPSV